MRKTSSQELAFFTSPGHPCSYLPNRTAGTLFVDPGTELNTRTYTELLRFGFRRSGDYVYRPRCHGCQACVPIRIPVNDYQRQRNQRRTWQRHSDIQVIAKPADFNVEHYALYRRYVKARHPGGGMDNPGPEQYMEFLTSSWGCTLFYEYRLTSRLVGVGVVDHLEDALSAVYTFYEPSLARRSLGVYAVLWEIDAARRLDLPWLYLGYWIGGCDKMNYKDRYRPLEAYIEGHWVRFENGEPILA